MTFHIFFFTTALQKKTLSEAEILREQQIKVIMDEVKERQSSYYNRLY
ncbi:hypothetical protein IIC_01511 [Bacillus cereus VD021]|uniref:Sporulation protein n=1 Tax=Bacillus cereus VD021 TaxID=1053224 RepID=R8HWK7_BACCE|nr:YrzI family small protein [Bacillus cereus]EOO77260.1 hypothetical protein IIC_01511 [Bacillus cereus VD021]